MRSTGAGNNASAEYESGWYSSLALAAVTKPTPRSSTGPWPHLEVPAVRATSSARYSIPTGTCTYQLTEEA